MKSAYFITSAAIALVVALVVALLGAWRTWQVKPRVEPFTTAPSQSESGAMPQPGRDEDLTKIPDNGSLRVYLTSFASILPDGEPSYVVDSHKWNNYIENTAIETNAMRAFGMNLNNPLSLDSAKRRMGLDMNGTRLTGFRSENLGVAAGAVNRTVPSMTLSWYAKWRDLPAANADVVLVRLYAETPNRVEVRMQASAADASKVNVRVLMGDRSKEYGAPEWVIDRGELVAANGLPVLCTLVFDRTTVPKPTLQFYVGTRLVSSAIQMEDNPEIKLGNSPMEINETGTWKANLFSFMLWHSALNAGAISSVQQYLEGQMNRAYDLEMEVADLRTRNRESETDMDTLLANMRGILAQCRAAANNGARKRPPSDAWQIRVDGTESAAAMADASCLTVKNPFSAGATVAAGVAAGAVGTITVPSTTAASTTSTASTASTATGTVKTAALPQVNYP